MEKLKHCLTIKQGVNWIVDVKLSILRHWLGMYRTIMLISCILILEMLLIMKSNSKSLMKCLIADTFSSGPALHYNLLLPVYFPIDTFLGGGIYN